MILNRQRKVRVAVRTLDKFLARACKELRVSHDVLTVCLVTNNEIKKWNGAYRHKNKPTDVLSFPATASKNGRIARQFTRKYLGDVAIAPEVARANAKEFGRTFEQEMQILIVHGILHLMGYDHEADDGRMMRREMRVRRKLGIE